MAGTPGSNEYESVVDDDEGEGILSHIQTDCTTYPGRESIDVVCEGTFLNSANSV